MSFSNQLIPPRGQTLAGWLGEARTSLSAGRWPDDCWAVDPEQQAVLYRTGRGHDIDDHDQESWVFRIGADQYGFKTRQLAYQVQQLAPVRQIALVREIVLFWAHAPFRGVPPEAHVRAIADALRTYGEHGAAIPGVECAQTLMWAGDVL